MTQVTDEKPFYNFGVLTKINISLLELIGVFLKCALKSKTSRRLITNLEERMVIMECFIKETYWKK